MKISKFDIINHGVEHEQYFQGCGVAFSPFDACFTGIGHDLSEAFADALEQLSCAGWEISEDLENEIRNQEDHGNTSGNADDCYYYLSVRVK